jgi:hypothetical protein
VIFRSLERSIVLVCDRLGLVERRKRVVVAEPVVVAAAAVEAQLGHLIVEC